MMAGLITYLRTYAQALPVVEQVASKTLEVARSIIRAGQVIRRDLTASDLGITDFKLEVPAGNTGEVDYIGSATSPVTVPDRKAIGIYGIVLEKEDENVHVDYIDLYVGGSRVRRWVLHPIKDGADTGKTLYLTSDQAIVLKEGSKFYVKVRAVNEDGSNPHDVRIVFLGFVAEPANEVIAKA